MEEIYCFFSSNNENRGCSLKDDFFIIVHFKLIEMQRQSFYDSTFLFWEQYRFLMKGTLWYRHNQAF